MAATSYGVNDPLAVKTWSKRLMVEALKQTYAKRFMGEGSANIIQVKDELSKGPGDKITYGLRMQLNGVGVIGDGTLEGNEESLTTYNGSIVINQLRHAVRSAGRMSQQRVPFSIREEALSGLVDWWSNKIDLGFMNQLGCNTAEPVYVGTAGTQNTGLQAPFSLPKTDIHYLSAHTAATGDENITSSDIWTLSLIDRAIERATTMGTQGIPTTSPAIRPVKIAGKSFYVAFIHTYQKTDLRTNTATGQFLDIQKAAMTGGEIEDNPIFDGSLGVYNNTIIHADVRVPTGVNSSTSTTAISTVYRSLFCGAQAAVIAFGRENGPNKMTWVEELFDYENQLGVSAGMIWGLNSTQFNNSLFGNIVMSTYGAQH